MVGSENALKISLSKELEEGLKFIYEFDKKKRWEEQQDPNTICPCKEDFSPDERILAHWLTYIPNRMTKAETIWDSKANKRTVSVYEQYLHLIKSRDWEQIKLAIKNKGFEINGFSSVKLLIRYEPDKKLIERTWSILKSYELNIVKFIFEQVKRFEDKGDERIIKKLACSLFLLTYENKVEEEKIMRILTNNEEFEKYYNRWEKGANINKKRLWAAFRDYIRLGPIWQPYFIEALKKMNADSAYIDLWNRFGKEFVFLNQLELPGDIWNEQEDFCTEFLAPLAFALGVKIQIKDVPKIVRAVCNLLQEREEYKGKIFPEQFDFVWGGETDKKTKQRRPLGNFLDKIRMNKPM